MAEPFFGEIKVYALPFAPTNWAFCNGQILQIKQFPALASLLGKVFGGDGTTTFGLPDMRGRVPVGAGTSPLTQTVYTLGQSGGSESVVLTLQQLPPHTHAAYGVTTAANKVTPGGNMPATPATGTNVYAQRSGLTTLTTFPSAMISNAGASAGHENRQPFLGLNVCIALLGIYPQRQ
jgi:microcystin-dependent protein